MTETGLDLTISLDAGKDVTEQMMDELIRRVHQDIIQAGVDSVRRAQGGEIPEGAMGIPIDLNTLIVTLVSSGTLVAILQLLKGWVLSKNGRMVKIRTEIDGNSIEYEYPPKAISEGDLTALVEKQIQLLNKSKIERP